jgi:hypothetical protein
MLCMNEDPRAFSWHHLVDKNAHLGFNKRFGLSPFPGSSECADLCILTVDDVDPKDLTHPPLVEGSGRASTPQPSVPQPLVCIDGHVNVEWKGDPDTTEGHNDITPGDSTWRPSTNKKSWLGSDLLWLKAQLSLRRATVSK